MNVPQIMESRHRESPRIGPEDDIVRPDDLGHERSHAVWIDRRPVARGEHVARLGPGIAQSNLILNLPSTLSTQNIDGPRVQAHDALSSALRGALNPLTCDDAD